MPETTNRTGPYSSVPRMLWIRFQSHILVTLFLDTSRMMQPPISNSSTVAPFLLGIQWMVLFAGILGGGGMTGLVHWAFAEMMDLSWILVGLVLAAVIGAGPDLMPPLTPMNGCEDPKHRIVYSLVFGFIYATTDYSNQVLWTTSAIWHLVQGDSNFKAATTSLAAYLRHLEQTGQQERMDQTLVEAPKKLLVYYFRVGAGMGILLTTYQIYSWKLFLSLLGSFVGANVIFYLLTPDHQEHERVD